MPINSYTGAVSLGGTVVGQSVNLELRNNFNAQISCNDFATRALAADATSLSFNSFYTQRALNYYLGNNSAGSDENYTVSVTHGADKSINLYYLFTHIAITASNDRFPRNTYYDGVAATVKYQTQDNTNSEHVSQQVSLFDVTNDLTKVISFDILNSLDQLASCNGVGIITHDIVSAKPVSVRSNTMVFDGTYPYTHNLTGLEVGDIILVSVSYRYSTTGDATVTNMLGRRANLFASNRYTSLHYAYATGSTFSTTVSLQDLNQQYTHGITVLRF